MIFWLKSEPPPPPPQEKEYREAETDRGAAKRERLRALDEALASPGLALKIIEKAMAEGNGEPDEDEDQDEEPETT